MGFLFLPKGGKLCGQFLAEGYKTKAGWSSVAILPLWESMTSNSSHASGQKKGGQTNQRGLVMAVKISVCGRVWCFSLWVALWGGWPALAPIKVFLYMWCFRPQCMLRFLPWVLFLLKCMRCFWSHDAPLIKASFCWAKMCPERLPTLWKLRRRQTSCFSYPMALSP